MKRPTCERMFEVEALRAGRLSGAERGHFERHLMSCAACSNEAVELEALGNALRASSHAGADELHVRRERTRLLASFDRILVAQESSWSTGRGRLWLTALGATLTLALLSGSFFLGRARRPAQTIELAKTTVRADAEALWSRKQGSRDQIFLERGTLFIHVVHSAGTLPLLVELPDGELEDTGTTFSVTVEGGHTMRVAVEEGSVMFHRREQEPVTIGAGDAWTAVSRFSVSTDATIPVEPPPRGAASSPVRQEAPPRAVASLASSSISVSSAGALPNASDGFRAAVAVLDSGENREAAVRFERFLDQHPRDPRAEDAAYLRVLALRRAGDKGVMRAAALDYLRRFPAGFRRAEVEILAR